MGFIRLTESHELLRGSQLPSVRLPRVQREINTSVQWQIEIINPSQLVNRGGRGADEDQQISPGTGAHTEGHETKEIKKSVPPRRLHSFCGEKRSIDNTKRNTTDYREKNKD